jgi:hypothetical protein
MPIPLRKVDKLYEGDLKEGQHVLFQYYVDTDPETDMPLIVIAVAQIESVNIEKETVTLKDKEGPQPWYRIRYVIENKKIYIYPGYDSNAIMRDEGEITDETYNALRELEAKDA